MRLSELGRQQEAIVASVESRMDADSIARRLQDIGFVAGETVKVITCAPWGGDPLLVQIGTSRFALRKAEAQRVILQAGVQG